MSIHFKGVCLIKAVNEEQWDYTVQDLRYSIFNFDLRGDLQYKQVVIFAVVFSR